MSEQYQLTFDDLVELPVKTADEAFESWKGVIVDGPGKLYRLWLRVNQLETDNEDLLDTVHDLVGRLQSLEYEVACLKDANHQLLDELNRVYG